MEAALGGADGDGESGGDFFQGHVVDEAHEEDFTVCVADSGQGAGEELTLCGGVGRLRRGGDGDFIVEGFLTAALAADGKCGVLDGGVEEGGDAGAEIEAGAKFPGEVGKGFLQGVVGVGLVLGEAPGKAVGPILVAVIERVEGSPVAGVDGGDKLGVGARIVLLGHGTLAAKTGTG